MRLETLRGDLAYAVRSLRRRKAFAATAMASLAFGIAAACALVGRQNAAELNTPDWLWARWLEVYGPEEAHRMADQHMAEPPLDLTVKSEPQGWAGKLGGVVLPMGSVRLAAKGRVEELEGFA